MLDHVRIQTAADGVVEAALAGEPWDEPLLHLAHAAGARDAVLMRNSPTRMMAAFATPEAAEAVAAFAAGRAPPNSRYARVRIGPRDGFRLDHDDYESEELARDPFYQEFLRPAGLFWHANAVLDSFEGEQLELSFKRRIGHGPYAQRDAEALDAILPDLRAASRIARHMLDAETRGMSRLLKARGLLTVEFDRLARVLATHGESRLSHPPVEIVGRRLVAVDRICQPDLDRAIATALAGGNRQIALAALTGADERRYIMQIHPLPGRARDIFLAASAVAVLIERDRPPARSLAFAQPIARLFGLTEREAEVVCLRAEGMEFTAIARILGISPDTARTYLKFAYDKIGISRQAELAALLNRLSN